MPINGTNIPEEEEVEKCPSCDTELEVDESGAAYCPSETCPRFMVDIDIDEEETGAIFDDIDEDEDIYGDS